MFRVFMIIWSIIAVLLLCFEFYAEQELKRAIGTDNEKIANYKRCGLWNIIFCIFFFVSVVCFAIADASSYIAPIIILAGQSIRALFVAISYYKGK